MIERYLILGEQKMRVVTDSAMRELRQFWVRAILCMIAVHISIAVTTVFRNWLIFARLAYIYDLAELVTCINLALYWLNLVEKHLRPVALVLFVYVSYYTPLLLIQI